MGPQLGKFYDSIKDSKNFEIIFVSSDRDASQFKEYYDEQAAWAALPFKDRATKNALSKKYKVRGIPTLVILDGKTGETITLDGRDGVSSEPEAFPWKPPSVQDILAALPPFVDKEGEEVSLSERPGPLLLYFSAHWCPPCRGFTPKLVEFFSELEKKYPEASIAFVSSDKDSKAWASYYQSMGENWLSLPYDARDQKEKLSKAFGVSGIPSLVLLDSEANGRNTITTSGRSFVMENQIEDFPRSWAPKPYADLFVHPTEEKSDTLFFYATEDAGIAEQVVRLCDIKPPKGEATLVLLDLDDDGAYYLANTSDVSEGALAKFLKEPGPRQQLKSP